MCARGEEADRKLSGGCARCAHYCMDIAWCWAWVIGKGRGVFADGMAKFPRTEWRMIYGGLTRSINTGLTPAAEVHAQTCRLLGWRGWLHRTRVDVLKSVAVKPAHTTFGVCWRPGTGPTTQHGTLFFVCSFEATQRHSAFEGCLEGCTAPKERLAV